MRLRLTDRLFGVARVDVWGDGRWVGLERPTVRRWVGWHARHAEMVAAMPGAVSVPVFEQWLFDRSGCPELLWAMIDESTPGGVDVGADRGLRDGLRVACADLAAAGALLNFWWDWPLSPWPRPGTEQARLDAERRERERLFADDDDDGGKKRRSIASDLPGGLATLAMMYRALGERGLGAGWPPGVVDGLELWQVGVLLDRDVPEVGESGSGVKRRSDGVVERMRWGRRPGQPFLFTGGLKPGVDTALPARFDRAAAGRS